MLASESNQPAISDSPPSDAGAGSSKFVPIRPAFRPLLPKPTPPSGSEPTVVIKSHSRTGAKLVKKRKSDAGPLANTIAPSSLVTKRRKSPPATGSLDRPRRRNTGDSRNSDDDMSFSSKEGSVSPPDSKDLLAPPSTLSLSMLTKNADDSSLYSTSKLSLSTTVKTKPMLVPASPPTSERSVKNSDVLLSSTTLEGFMEPLQDLALELSQQSSLASPTEQFDALEGLNFDELDVGAFLAPSTQTDDGDANGFDPMEIFGPRLDIF